jgi:hypothetical protein
MIYPTEEAAFRRVETLKKQGRCPGVRRVEGGWELTSDPDMAGEPAPDLPSAPQSELGWERGTHRQHEPAGSRREHGRPEAGPPLVTDAGIERVLP